MATSVEAKRAVVIGVLTAGGITVLKTIVVDEKPADVRIGVGVMFAGVTLSIASEFVPDLAFAFALLILVTSLVLYGGPLYDRIIGATKAPPAPLRGAGPLLPGQTRTTP